nr:MAG TPA: hypothetical protein [Caudoviricetes sp.]
MKLPLPPTLRGSPQEQLQQLYRYLYRLAELLNAREERKKE